jgi:hypothetical protein
MLFVGQCFSSECDDWTWHLPGASPTLYGWRAPMQGSRASHPLRTLMELVQQLWSLIS